MTKWYERANEASFKRLPEGYVFQAPSPWMLARPGYYLVNSGQKAALLASLGKWRLLLLIVTVTELALSLSITLPMILWPRTFGRLFLPLYQLLGPGLFILLLSVVMILLTVPLFAVPQIYLARALRPVLAHAPRTEARITLGEQLPQIAASASDRLLACGLIGGAAMIISGILLMIDGSQEGHLLRSATYSATLLVIGALLTAYFVYLLRLKGKSKLIKIA